MVHFHLLNTAIGELRMLIPGKRESHGRNYSGRQREIAGKPRVDDRIEIVSLPVRSRNAQAHYRLPLCIDGCRDHAVGVWERGPIRCTARKPIRTYQICASGGFDGTVRVWDPELGRQRLSIAVAGGFTRVSSSGNGRLIVAGTGSARAGVWDAATGRKIAALDGPEGRVYIAALSPDGSRVITAGYDGKDMMAPSSDVFARIWDTASGRVHAALKGHTGPVFDAAFSGDGGRALTASSDGTVRIWDAGTGKLLQALRPSGAAAPIFAAAFTPDGTNVAIGRQDGAVDVLNISNGREVAKIVGHTGAIRSIVFTPDGRRMESVW